MRRKAMPTDLREEREAYVRANSCCIPWCREPAQDCHEIARGAHRKLAVADRRAWLATCRWHHEELGDYSRWPVSRQYALKAIQDMAFFDRIRLNLLRGRAKDAVDECEVLVAVIGVMQRKCRLA